MNLGLHLLQVESVGDVVSDQEGRDQVGDGARLTTVGTELEGVQSSLPAGRKVFVSVLSHLTGGKKLIIIVLFV